jgi:hypothetical protein
MKKYPLLYIGIYLIIVGLFACLMLRYDRIFFDQSDLNSFLYMPVLLLILTYLLYSLLYFQVHKGDKLALMVLPFALSIASIFSSQYITTFIRPLRTWHIIAIYASVYSILCSLIGMKLFRLIKKA